MRCLLLSLVAVAALSAADDGELALTLRAQADFDRVELSPAPRLEDATACEQSQAALLAVAGPEQGAALHYRKGICALTAAALTGNAARFSDAAGEFGKAIESWPARAKGAPAGPVSPALPVLAAIARLHAAADAAAGNAAGQRIAAAEAAPDCSSNLLPAAACRRWLAAGREWLGWLAVQSGDLDAAARDFSGLDAAGWPEWIAGRRAFEEALYGQAAQHYARAVEAWRTIAREPAPALDVRLAPQPAMASVLTDLGGAQLLAGDPTAAIATLNAAVKAGPADARTIYLRARAKEKAGETQDALEDYNLASRTAFAAARDLASGEAHLYRGILLYRRKDYTRAEDEFSSALNFDIPAALRADTVAWRHLAAVAGGACEASRLELRQSLNSVSPYFPKDEAASRIAACSAGGD